MKKDICFRLRLSKVDREALNTLAEKYHCGLSEAVRRAVWQVLEHTTGVSTVLTSTKQEELYTQQ